MNTLIVVCYLSLAFIILAIIICSIRMYKGPSLSDRIIALDLAANIAISFIAIYSVIANQPVYIDVVIALALIIFLTTVAFANLISNQSKIMKASSEDLSV